MGYLQITGDAEERASAATELLECSLAVDITYPSGDRLTVPGSAAAAELADDGRLDRYSVDINVTKQGGRWGTTVHDESPVYTIRADGDDGEYRLEWLMPDHPAEWVDEQGYDCTVQTDTGTEIVSGRYKV